MGGGSGGGAVSFPDYIEAAHYAFLVNEPKVNNKFFEPGAGDPQDKLILSVKDILRAYVGPLHYSTFPNRTGAPYNAEYDPPPGLWRAEVPPDHTDQADSLITEAQALATAFSARSAQTDYAALLLKSATEIDIAGRINDLSLTQIYVDAEARTGDTWQYAKDSGYVGANSTALSNANESTLWQQYIDDVKTKADEAGVLTTIDWSTIEAGAITDAAAFMTAALSNRTTGIDEVAEWQTFIDTVVAKLKSCGVLDEIDVPALYNQAFAQAGRSVEEAIRVAAELIDDDLLAPVVAGYEERATYQKEKAVRLFTGQMADINAEHSSAFLIGLALIEAQHRSDVNRFDAELTLGTYQEAVRQHGTRMQEYFRNALEASAEDVRARSQIFLQGLSNLVDLQAGRVRFEQSLTQLFGQTYGTQVSGNMQADTTNKERRDALVMDSIRILQAMLDAKKRVEMSLHNLYGSIFASHISTQIEMETINKRSREVMLQYGVQQMAGDLYKAHQLQLEQYEAIKQARAFKVTAEKEYYEDMIDMRVKNALWPIFYYEHVANVLAAPSGMAGIVQPGMSKTQSAVSGALVGAGAGAKIGTMVGGPAGAGIGALIGGGLGLLGGLS